MSDEILKLSAAEIAKRVRGKEISAAETAEAFLGHAERAGSSLNSWILLDKEGAMRAARAVDAAVSSGKNPGPLAGVPVGLKDLVDMAGLPTTAGSVIDRDRVADEDAPLAKKIRASGAVILGKLNLHEYAFGPTGHNPHYGDQKNPWDPERITGGSSGGSGNSVATGQVSVAIGSDTGGSIRIPASLCGTFGHKPTFGLVTKSRCAPLSWSLDSFGPLARSAEDCALMMSAISGHDPTDPSSIEAEIPDFMRALDTPLRGLRVGHARSYYTGRSSPEVVRAVEDIAKAFLEAGAEVFEIDIPGLDEAYQAGGVMMVAEAAAVHEKNIRERPDDYDPRVIERIRPGFFIPVTSYLQAQRFRGEWTKRVLHEVFGKVDAVLSATTPVTAPLRSARSVTMNGKDVEIRPLMISLTRLWNFFGGPSVTFPAGMSTQGLPIGAQLMGAPFEDDRILGAVHQLEKSGAISAKLAPS